MSACSPAFAHSGTELRRTRRHVDLGPRSGRAFELAIPETAVTVIEGFGAFASGRLRPFLRGDVLIVPEEVLGVVLALERDELFIVWPVRCRR